MFLSCCIFNGMFATDLICVLSDLCAAGVFYYLLIFVFCDIQLCFICQCVSITTTRQLLYCPEILIACSTVVCFLNRNFVYSKTTIETAAFCHLKLSIILQGRMTKILMANLSWGFKTMFVMGLGPAA